MIAAIIAMVILATFTLVILTFLISVVSTSLSNKEVHDENEEVGNNARNYIFVPLNPIDKIDAIKLIVGLTGSTGMICLFIHLHTGKGIDPGFAVLVMGGLSTLVIAATLGFCLAYMRLVHR